jgi:phosphatidylethanolamine/phosphatidyl-N-methylethanolamine N-methyltransferase
VAPESDPTRHARDLLYWERHAAHYDHSLRMLRKPLPRMIELTAEAVRGTQRVLEVAAGTGLVTAALAESAQSVLATDYAPGMVAIVERRMREAGYSHVHCQQADLYSLPFADASFDIVVAANVLHLVPNLETALSSLGRVLAPSGRLIAPTFCHDETARSWVLSRILALTGFPSHRRFSARSFRGTLEICGLELLRTETLSGVIPIEYVEARFRTATGAPLDNPAAPSLPSTPSSHRL